MVVESDLNLKTPDQFSYMIESLAVKLGTSVMDTIIYYCEEHKIEIESASKLLNKSVKNKIQLEAEDLNFLPKTSRLPF